MTKKTDAPVAHLKKSARALQRYLVRQGLELPLGKALDALAVMQGHSDWNSLSAAVRAAPAPSALRGTDASRIDPTRIDSFDIRSVPLEKVTNVVVGGEPFTVRYREEALIARWREGGLSADDAEDTDALQLGREEDGLVWDEQATFGELDALVWSPQQRCFVTPEGETWRFFVESEFGVDSLPESARPFVLARPAKAAPVRPAKAKAPKAPRLYSVALYALNDEMPAAFLGKRTFAVMTEKAARQAAYEELWDDRLDAGDARPDYFVERLDDDEGGEFVVFIDDGEYDRFESFAAAWKVATFMFDETAETSVTIENAEGETVFRLKK